MREDLQQIDKENKQLTRKCGELSNSAYALFDKIKQYNIHSASIIDSHFQYSHHIQSKTKAKLCQIDDKLLKRQVGIQMVRDYREAIIKYGQIVNDLRGKVLEKQFSLFQNTELLQTIYPYKVFIPTEENVNYLHLAEAHRKIIQKLMKELTGLREELGKGQKMKELKRQKNLEGYISDRSRKRLCEKIMKKVVEENQKQKKLKEEYKNYVDIYKIVKDGNKKNRQQYLTENINMEGENILCQIDEIEEDTQYDQTLKKSQ